MRLGKLPIKRVTVCALLISLCFIFSFIEKMIPLNFSYYGFKLGLANIVIVFALYKLPIFDTLIVLLAKTVISGIVFGGPVYLLFSLVGGIFSFLIMLISKKWLNVITVSVLGAVFFNIGQVLVSCFIFSFNLIYYLPIMVLTAVFTGIVIGVLSNVSIKRIKV